jgi:hypothetical protein
VTLTTSPLEKCPSCGRDVPNTSHCVGLNKAGKDAFCRREERAEIERLAAVVHDKQQLFRMFGMLNTIGLTPEELKQQTRAYELARREMWRAESELQTAQLRGLFGASQ